MTAFRPGDLAVVTGDTAQVGHPFDPGEVVEIVAVTDLGGVGYICVSVSKAFGAWRIAEIDLRPPTPSPLDALIESAAALIQDVRAGRVRIEATLLTPDRTDYRVIVTPEEKS